MFQKRFPLHMEGLGRPLGGNCAVAVVDVDMVDYAPCIWFNGGPASWLDATQCIMSVDSGVNKWLESCSYFQQCKTADIGKSTGPWSSTSENSGGPMKTLIVPVLLSGKKFLKGAPLWGLLCWKNYIRSCKSFGGPVKLGFSMWLPLPVLWSGKGPKVFPMSETAPEDCIWLPDTGSILTLYFSKKSLYLDNKLFQIASRLSSTSQPQHWWAVSGWLV